MIPRRTIDLFFGKDVDRVRVYMFAPPRVGGEVKLLVRDPLDFNQKRAMFARFIVKKIWRDKFIYSGGQKKVLVELKKVV